MFLQAAAAIENGHSATAFASYPFYLYLGILAGLHHLGLGWEVAAKLWGVGISSLVIFPLFGWVRRQFDDRIAWLACFLYAVHPGLILWSPEPIRCPTYWFLFVQSLYLLWRATTETRFRLFGLGGLMLGGTVLTRLEGGFLLIPLVCWSLGHLRNHGIPRWRLLLGMTLAAAAFPALVVGLGFFLAPGGLNGTALSFAKQKLATVLPLAQARVAVTLGMGSQRVHQLLWPPSYLGEPNCLSFGKLLGVYVRKLGGGVGPLHGLFLLTGLWGWNSMGRRRDQVPLFLVCLALLASIAVYLVAFGTISERYFFTLVLLGSPYMALGFWTWAQWLQQRAWNLTGRTWSFSGIITLFLTGTALAGFVKISWHDHSDREGVKSLGTWVAQWGRRSRCQDEPRNADILVHGLDANSLAYFANLRQISDDRFLFPGPLTGPAMVAAIKSHQPEIVILSRMQTQAEILKLVEKEANGLGMSQVHARELPPQCSWALVYVRVPHPWLESTSVGATNRLTQASELRVVSR